MGPLRRLPLLCMLLFSTLPLPAQLYTDAAIGFGGRYLRGAWTPVWIFLENGGEQLEGRLQLLQQSSSLQPAGGYTLLQKVELRYGERKRYPITLPLDRGYRPLQLRVTDAQGRELLNRDISLRNGGLDAAMILDLTADASIAAQLSGSTAHPLVLPYAELYPGHRRGYEGVAAVAIDPRGFARLSLQQSRALSAYVAGGGRCLVLPARGGGATAARPAGTEGEAPKLLPMPSGGGTETLPAGALAGLERVAPLPAALPERVPLFLSRTLPGTPLLEAEGRVLLSGLRWGSGSLLYLGFDPFRPPLALWEGGRVLAERFLKGEAVAGSPSPFPSPPPAELISAAAEIPIRPEWGTAFTLPRSAWLIAALLLPVLSLGGAAAAAYRGYRRATAASLAAALLISAPLALFGFYLPLHARPTAAVSLETALLFPEAPSLAFRSYSVLSFFDRELLLEGDRGSLVLDHGGAGRSVLSGGTAQRLRTRSWRSKTAGFEGLVRSPLEASLAPGGGDSFASELLTVRNHGTTILELFYIAGGASVPLGSLDRGTSELIIGPRREGYFRSMEERVRGRKAAVRAFHRLREALRARTEHTEEAFLLATYDHPLLDCRLIPEAVETEHLTVAVYPLRGEMVEEEEADASGRP